MSAMTPTLKKKSSRQRMPRVGRPKGRFTTHRNLDTLRALLEQHQTGLTLAELATSRHGSLLSLIKTHIDEDGRFDFGFGL